MKRTKRSSYNNGSVKGTKKNCCFGVCKSDSRSKNHTDGLYHFISFPKPCYDYRRELIKTKPKIHINQCEQCSKAALWVKLCRRADGRFQNIDHITKDTYICSLHFEDQKNPTESFPKPINYDEDGNIIKKIKRERKSLSEKYAVASNKFQIGIAEVKSVEILEESNTEKNIADISGGTGSSIPGHLYKESMDKELELSADPCYDIISDSTLSFSSDFPENGFPEMQNSHLQANPTVIAHSPFTTVKYIESCNNCSLMVTKCDGSTQTYYSSSLSERKSQATSTLSNNGTQTDRVRTANKKIQTVNYTLAACDFETSLKLNEKKCQFYTGLHFDHIKAIHKFVSPACEQLAYWGSDIRTEEKDRIKPKKCKLTSFQQLLLLLVRLRVGLLVEDLAYRFEVSIGLTSKIITTWIQFLHKEFVLYLKPNMFPSRRVIAKTLPKVFQKMKNIRVLVDCTEFYCESPSNFEQQGNLYSAYKHHTTFKCFIGCTPNGAISFVSEMYEGAISDRQIFLQSKITDLLEPGDLVLADRGFKVHDIVEAKGAILNIPPFLNGRDCLTPQEEIETKRIAKQRIYVEHAVGQIKNFQLLKKILPLKLRGLMSEIVFICACLVNFQPPHVIDDESGEGTI